jgi:TetR/AcrR family transcriptional regulator, biofilm operon repressor
VETQDTLDTLITQAATTKEKLFYSALRLFAQKGYSNVGIRELCRSIRIKESSFYNHYAGKESLLKAILAYFGEASGRVVMTDAEIEAYIRAGDVRAFFLENMKKFEAVTSAVPYRTALKIVLTESFLHPTAAEMAKRNLYHLRKDYTERVLRGMMKAGAIRQCDTETVTAEYYYALKGMLDEYLLLLVWDGDLSEIKRRIAAHIDFFTGLLTPSNDERNSA